MWLPKKTQLLGWAESLKRSSIELPDDFEERMTALRVKWDQLEVRFYIHSIFSQSSASFCVLNSFSRTEMAKLTKS